MSLWQTTTSPFLHFPNLKELQLTMFASRIATRTVVAPRMAASRQVKVSVVILVFRGKGVGRSCLADEDFCNLFVFLVGQRSMATVPPPPGPGAGMPPPPPPPPPRAPAGGPSEYRHKSVIR